MRKPKKKTKQQIEDEAAFVKLQAKWDRIYGPLTSKSRRPAEMPKLAAPPGREIVVVYPSISTPGGSTARKADQFYTGSKAIGVALMHKSNYAPVFEEKDALDIARMRR